MAGLFGFFNNYYYGKAGKADYTPEQLPANRVSLFWEMLRVRFTGLFGINLLTVAFSIPAIVWSYINLSVMLAAGGENAPAIDFVADGYLFMYLVGMIPCLSIAAVGSVGAAYVLRNWARDQHSFVWSDFKDAVKGNWKYALLTGALNGLSLFMTYVGFIYYGQMAQSSAFWIVPQMLLVLFCAVWWMINMLIFPMMVTYEMKYGQLLRNCAIMVIARLPFSVLFWGGSVALPLILIFLVPYGYIVAIFLYLLLGLALTGFVYASYANSCFDKYLNPRIEGAPVNMGLRDPNADEDLDDIEDPNPLS